MTQSSEKRTSPRKEPQELQQKDDHAQTCSLLKKSPRKEVLKKSRAETCSQARKTSKESQKKSREDAQAGTQSTAVAQENQPPKSVHFAKKLQEVCSKEGERRPTRREQSVMSRSGACSSNSDERHVRIVERHRQNPVNILKRPAFGRGDDLIISTSMLKKTRTDYIVSQVRQVRQKVGERREIEVKRRDRRRNQKCWAPGYVSDARYLKAHACYDHIPSIFDERLEPTDERVLCGRRNALKQAGRWLLGRPVELDELVSFVVVQKMLSPTYNIEISKRQERAIEEFCKFLHEPVPDKFEMEYCFTGRLFF